MIKIFLHMVVLEIKRLYKYKVNLFGEYVIKIIACTGQLMLIKYVFKEKTLIANYSISQMTVYIALMFAIYDIMTTDVDSLIRYYIRSGRVSVLLVRPIFFGQQIYFQIAAKKVARLICLAFPLFVSIITLFNVNILSFVSKSSLILTFIALIIGFNFDFFMRLLVGLFVIRLRENINASRIVQSVLRIISGSLIPITFFPGVLQSIFLKLPFKYVAYVPGSFLVSEIELFHSISVLGIGILWVIGFFLLTVLVYTSQMKKLVVFGG